MPLLFFFISWKNMDRTDLLCDILTPLCLFFYFLRTKFLFLIFIMSNFLECPTAQILTAYFNVTPSFVRLVFQQESCNLGCERNVFSFCLKISPSFIYSQLCELLSQILFELNSLVKNSP